MMGANRVLRRIDGMDDRTFGLIICFLVVVGALSGQASSLPTIASDTIKCICRTVGLEYALSFKAPSVELHSCNAEDTDHCICYQGGEPIDMDIPHVSWLEPDSTDQEVDIICTKKSDIHKRSPSKDDEKEEEASQKAAVSTVVKTNPISRTISGSGSIIAGAGNLVGGGFEQIGDAAGSAISGGFHIAGKVTKKVVGFLGDSVKNVGGVFESSKTITRNRRSAEILDEPSDMETPATAMVTRNKRSTETHTQQPSTELPSNLEKAKHIQEAGEGLNTAAQIFLNAAELINLGFKVSEVKDRLYEDYGEDDERDLINAIMAEFHDDVVTAETNAVQLLSNMKEPENSGKSVWSRVKHIKDIAAGSSSVSNFIVKMDEDKDLCDFEKKFASSFRDGFKKSLHCSAFNRGSKVSDWSTVADVLAFLKEREIVCGETSDEARQLYQILEAVPEAKVRERRSISERAKPALRPAGKPIGKRAGSGSKKETKYKDDGSRAPARRRKRKQHRKSAQDEHEDAHHEEEGADEAQHHEEDEDESYEEHDDPQDEGDIHHHSEADSKLCTCDPDTGRKLS